MDQHQMDDLSRALKGARCLLTHLHQRKKIKRFGPVANSEQARFPFDDGAGGSADMTVAEYFAAKHLTDPKR